MTQISETIPKFWIKHEFLKNSFLSLTIHEWNDLCPNIRKPESINFFKNNILKFTRP